MYPILIVIAGYLAADIFLDGYNAALAVLALGLGEFLFLLVFRGTKHPALILEGAVLAAAGLTGEILASRGYSGAGYVLLELILAGVLLISTARGKPWLASQMKRVAGFSAGREFSGEMSIVMGLVFLSHGTLLALLIVLKGSVPVIPAILSFGVLYLLAIFHLRIKQRRRSEECAPLLQRGDEGKLILELSGEKLGSMMLKPGAVTIVTEVEIAENLPVHKFLETLERYLKFQGCRTVRFTVWNGDEITLEMSGYRKTQAGWNKLL
ncbi:MAG: hypothetical protein KAR44_06985 [Candidatus Aegiribacteria sp.]|nr:hypothetical protein [Candidatus Aegiribacteria sp.]